MQTNHFPTDLIWGIANKASTTQKHTQKEVVDILNVMYPGINYWFTQLNQVVRELASDDLNEQFEKKLTGFKTESEAIAVLGNEIEIREVKPCKGYEWEGWLEKKTAVSSPAPDA